MGAMISVRTARLGLVFQRLETGKRRVLQGYVNADYARDLDQRRFTTGYVFIVVKCVCNIPIFKVRYLNKIYWYFKCVHVFIFFM